MIFRPILSVLLVLLCLSSLACPNRSDEETKNGTAASADVPKDESQRNRAAATALRHAANLSLPEKIDALRDVARLYWDTPSGPPAWSEVLYWMVENPNFDRLLVEKELSAFERRLGSSEDYARSCGVVAGAFLTHALREGISAERRIELNEARPALVGRWLKAIRNLAQNPAHAKDPAVLINWGDAAFAAAEWQEAENAWARVEDLNPPAPDARRLAVLTQRAELHRTQLKNNQRALELFEQAEKLTPSLDVHSDDVAGAYIRRAIAELKEGR